MVSKKKALILSIIFVALVFEICRETIRQSFVLDPEFFGPIAICAVILLAYFTANAWGKGWKD